MKDKIRWGIVGPGSIANRFANAVKNVAGAEVTAVASRSADRAREFADKHNIPNAFASYEEMANSTAVDAVYIATPHPFHKPYAELFLKAKKHVLCEKPICVNAKEAIDITECAKQNNVFLMEAMWTRFLPAIEEAVRVAQSGEIGEIRGVRAEFCFYSSPSPTSRLYAPELAGGALLDVGVYCLNFVAAFLGNDPEEIRSIANVQNGADYQTDVLLKYQGGAIASISAAVNVSKPVVGYVYGTKGYIRVPHFFGATEFFVNTNNEERRVHKPYIGDGFEEQIEEACSCIRNGKTQSDKMPMSESIKIMEQMDAVRKQIQLVYPFEV
ncbi:MAG: Gfo/Idh/MocA family oxidoreductase [Clostridia bacterium]|nr:Gfo/Idh/MocA family oxidoreductase [Clostridia bacterium]